MTQTANRRRKVEMPKDIRKKFAAALCMLLVAAIMMVGSTYAWFTLSTAPEVTGITTNVGANGNLEIALLNDTSFYDNTDNLGILTAVGDSMAKEGKPITEANETWGNLVDLSDASYGLDKMVLNPAAVNLNDEGQIFGGSTPIAIRGGLHSPLLAPSYGSDGRVISVQTATQAGKYSGTAFNEGTQIGGVRVIGVSSGVTLRISSYRSAVAMITTYMNAAKQNAQNSLVSNGQGLANMVLAYTADPAYALTQTDIDVLNSVVTSLQASVSSVGNAIKQAALAYALSSANAAELTDAQVETMVSAVNDADVTVAALNTATGVDVSGILSTSVDKYTALANQVNGVATTVNGLSVGDTYASVANSTADRVGIGSLLDKRYTSINGTMNPTKDDIGSVAGAAMSAGAVVVTMNPGSGIYADIAELVGDYTASGLTLSMSASGITVTDLPAIMNTNVIGYVAPAPAEGEEQAPSGPSAAYIVSAAGTAAAGDPAKSGATTIDDPYGYMIDFGVRTNAAGSSLLLDTDGSQRVYGDNTTNTSTQGGGSYLEFASADPDLFTVEDVKALMSAIRVIFVTPNADSDGYDILGIAAADITVSTAANGQRVVTAGDTVSEAEGIVRAKLELYNASSETMVDEKEYKLVLGAKKTTGEGDNLTADSTLCTLEQNKAKKISALVYLDGDIVDNTFVANAKTSITGKLNIQFKSSADLQPMDVRSMRDATEQARPASETLTAFRQVVTAVKGNAIYTAAVEAAEGGTDVQKALVSAVAAADALPNTASDFQVVTAGQNLKTACENAGITYPTNP